MVRLPRLSERTIIPGERWIYSADFNVTHENHTILGTSRIDAEIHDIQRIASAGGIVLILAHQGRYGKAESLEFILPYLSEQLGKTAEYCEENTGAKAQEFAQHLTPGSVAVMGNTRRHEGEERNDPQLAKEFSRLGDAVALGGFGKAHRANSSNVGILKHLPGYLTDNHCHEMETLSKWTGKSSKYSVAILGGVKREKIDIGLKGFAQIYDCIIPGGIVLNALLHTKGYSVGSSLMTDGKYQANIEESFISQASAQIVLPTQVIVTSTAHWSDRRISIVQDRTNGVKQNEAIVDYIMPSQGRECLERAIREGGRIVVAGTPSMITKGFTNATEALQPYLEHAGAQILILGGDTASEINHKGIVSTGGGSALQYLAFGTTAVLDALRHQPASFHKR